MQNKNRKLESYDSAMHLVRLPWKPDRGQSPRHPSRQVPARLRMAVAVLHYASPIVSAGQITVMIHQLLFCQYLTTSRVTNRSKVKKSLKNVLSNKKKKQVRGTSGDKILTKLYKPGPPAQLEPQLRPTVSRSPRKSWKWIRCTLDGGLAAQVSNTLTPMSSPLWQDGHKDGASRTLIRRSTDRLRTLSYRDGGSSRPHTPQTKPPRNKHGPMRTSNNAELTFLAMSDFLRIYQKGEISYAITTRGLHRSSEAER